MAILGDTTVTKLTSIGDVTLNGALNATGTITQNGTAVSLSNHTHKYAGSSSAGGAANSAVYASYPQGFTSKLTSQTWGNQTGTFITGWGVSDGALAFRVNSGSLNVITDGYFYQNASNKVLDESSSLDAAKLTGTIPAACYTNTQYSAATTSAAGLMSADDKKKLDGIATGANNYTYTLPTATSSVLGGVKTGSNITNSSGTISLTKANVTAALGYTPPTTNTTYSAFTAATASAAGKTGLVPAPAAGAQDKFLRGNATWATASDIINTLTEGSSSAQAADYVVCQYAGGGTTTTTYHRRPVSKLLDALTKAQVTTALGYTPPTTNTTYSNMTAATADAAGKAGLVPAPAAGKQTSFLRGDGTWVVPTNTTYSNFVKSGSGAKAGLVPAPSTTAGTTKYLREDGTWTVPPDTDTKVGSGITLTGYTKPSSTSAVAATDTVNAAIGKLEKALDSKQASGSYLTAHQTIKQNGVTGATRNCYGACTTAAATAAKAVSITAGTPTLEAGLKVTVKFNNANTASTPTLNVNSLGAKNIFHKGAKITTGDNKALLAGVCDFVYDGTQFHLVGNYTDTKVTNTLGTTTKFYVTGTTSATTATGTQYFDTGVYVSATAGNLYATTFNTGGNITMGGTSGTSYIQLPSGIKLY